MTIDNLHGLKQVAPLTFLSDPHPDGTITRRPVKSSHPTLVLILGFANASPRMMKRYINQHRTMFPDTPILLVTSPQSMFYAPRFHIQKLLRPAIHILSNLTNSFSSDNRILVHSFSNGGALTLKELSYLSYHTGDVEAKLEDCTMAIVMDSAPSSDTKMSTTIKAFKIPFEGSWLKYPAIGAMIGTNATMKILAATTPYQIPNTPLSPYLIHHFSSTPHLFIYSEADEIVPFESVEEHIADLREAGGEIRVFKVEGTEHCTHTKGEENKRMYWEEVESLWSDVSKRQGEKERKEVGEIRARL